MRVKGRKALAGLPPLSKYSLLGLDPLGGAVNGGQFERLYMILVYNGPAQKDGHEQHFSGATDGGYIPDLIDFKNHKAPHAPQGGHANKGGSGDNSAQVPLSSPGASSDTTKTWLQLGESMDIYSDEDEDEAAESTSFVTWLTNAFTPFMEQSRIKNKGESPQHGTPSAPSGQETTHETVRYFTYQPFAGFSNQFYCMLRAMHIAKRLNRTLLIPPITSSSHDVSRRNQAWSDFFDLDEFQAKTGLKVIEYHDLRDKGGFRGPTGVRESGTSLGGYWVPPHLIADPNNDKRYGRPLKTPPKRTSLQEKQMHSERYQHSFGTGTGSIDMSFPCHVTCGFGTKRSLDYTAKGFMRQWGFELKKLTLPTIVMSENATDNANLPESLRTKALPMDQTRDYDRIIQALEHETLRNESFLCVTNTYKIQMPRRPEDVGIGSFEFTDFGQFLKFQPKVMQVVDEYLEKVLGKAPESRVSYPKDTFWIPLSPPPPPAPADNQPMDPMAPPPFPVPVQQSPQEPSTDLDATQGPSVVVSARQEPLIKHTYFMLHIRRGDFETYCKDKVDVVKQAQCLPTNDRYVEIVRELQKRNRNETVNEGNATRIPVFVATNEGSPEKLQELRELGLQSFPGDEDGEEWRVINHTELQTVARLGPYGPVVLDQVLMAEAEAVLGVKMSTFSRVAEYRQRDWYGRRIMYV
ncbi:hypothetical protein BG006_007742 [Podila minutissima]|uniref:GDP-fucose protein O-fucosyltransferase 2 n=1 Tax=Podila minutissima TaxID=64525 RepID=A0A9P5VRH6_9FUNG|nr:hypothetical protein BG006_007742 [Podila minutissima]